MNEFVRVFDMIPMRSARLTRERAGVRRLMEAPSLSTWAVIRFQEIRVPVAKEKTRRLVLAVRVPIKFSPFRWATNAGARLGMSIMSRSHGKERLATSRVTE